MTCRRYAKTTLERGRSTKRKSGRRKPRPQPSRYPTLGRGITAGQAPIGGVTPPAIKISPGTHSARLSAYKLKTSSEGYLRREIAR
jgi:hypothetical protein